MRFNELLHLTQQILQIWTLPAAPEVGSSWSGVGGGHNVQHKAMCCALHFNHGPTNFSTEWLQEHVFHHFLAGRMGADSLSLLMCLFCVFSLKMTMDLTHVQQCCDLSLQSVHPNLLLLLLKLLLPKFHHMLRVEGANYPSRLEAMPRLIGFFRLAVLSPRSNKGHLNLLFWLHFCCYTQLCLRTASDVGRFNGLSVFSWFLLAEAHNSVLQWICPKSFGQSFLHEDNTPRQNNLKVLLYFAVTDKACVFVVAKGKVPSTTIFCLFHILQAYQCNLLATTVEVPVHSHTLTTLWCNAGLSHHLWVEWIAYGRQFILGRWFGQPQKESDETNPTPRIPIGTFGHGGSRPVSFYMVTNGSLLVLAFLYTKIELALLLLLCLFLNTEFIVRCICAFMGTPFRVTFVFLLNARKQCFVDVQHLLSRKGFGSVFKFFLGPLPAGPQYCVHHPSPLFVLAMCTLIEIWLLLDVCLSSSIFMVSEIWLLLDVCLFSPIFMVGEIWLLLDVCLSSSIFMVGEMWLLLDVCLSSSILMVGEIWLLFDVCLSSSIFMVGEMWLLLDVCLSSSILMVGEIWLLFDVCLSSSIFMVGEIWVLLDVCLSSSILMVGEIW